MVTRDPRDPRWREDPRTRRASDPDRTRDQEDTTAAPGEERRPVRRSGQPDIDEDVE